CMLRPAIPETRCQTWIVFEVRPSIFFLWCPCRNCSSGPDMGKTSSCFEIHWSLACRLAGHRTDLVEDKRAVEICSSDYCRPVFCIYLLVYERLLHEIQSRGWPLV